MQRIIIVTLASLLFFTAGAWSYDEHKIKRFRQNIPSIAKQFIGIPYQYGGNPVLSKTTDNSHLFYSIYEQAAQHAGLIYQEYKPMKYLLPGLEEVGEDDLENGDLMVLNNLHSAMVYQIDKSGKIHLIYASGKRKQVLTFNSDNVVFHVYWLKNLKGFYRLSAGSLR
ncbi:MAG: peptidoglycan endopeptidase [Desulfobacteraceae bacterium]|nr:MAG: peptidoglycan endopeptidase [Desulfobacteraceae bacterium]